MFRFQREPSEVLPLRQFVYYLLGYLSLFGLLTLLRSWGPQTLSQALNRAALISSFGLFLAFAYSAAFSLLTGKSGAELLPSVILAYGALGAFMLSRGLRSERSDNLLEAANYYTRALGYHLVATVLYLALNAAAASG